MPAEDLLASMRILIDPPVYTEPVLECSRLIDGGHLAFVKADAILYVGDEARRHNID